MSQEALTKLITRLESVANRLETVQISQPSKNLFLIKNSVINLTSKKKTSLLCFEKIYIFFDYRKLNSLNNNKFKKMVDGVKNVSNGVNGHAAVEEAHQSVIAFDDLLESALKAFVSTSNEIGGDVKTIVSFLGVA